MLFTKERERKKFIYIKMDIGIVNMRTTPELI